ncbi:sensor histidine kinase [Methylogaea oryzae]|nr:ATP-binding protein [Methylogaea oryzae]
MEWLLEDFSKRHGVAYELTMNEDELDLPECLAITVFRVIQEALTNVARHAMASSVRVCLERGEESIQIEVRDNGRGFDFRAKRQQKSYGLLGIQERIAALGGRFAIESEVGLGTAVRIELPHSEDRAECAA